MIGSTLQMVADELNSYICNRINSNPLNPKVLLSPIVGLDGALAIKEENILLLKLVNIEQDPIANGSVPVIPTKKGGILMESSPLYLNLRIILAAHFKAEQLKTGLDMLTMGIAYLQGKQLWNPQNTPALPKSINRLVFEMETLDLHQHSHLWGAIGSKALPCAVYKLKMLAITDHAIQGMVPEVQQVDSNVKNEVE